MILPEDEVTIRKIIDNWNLIWSNRISSNRCLCEQKFKSAVSDLKNIITNETYLENKQLE